MKIQWLIPVIALLVVGTVAYNVTKCTSCKARSFTLDSLQDVSFLARKLDLNETQTLALQRLHADLATQLRDCCARHCEARARLMNALLAETNGTTQTEALVTEMCRAYEQSERATLAQLRQVRAMLNTEQRKQFETMISENMCPACNMPDGRVPPDPMTHK